MPAVDCRTHYLNIGPGKLTGLRQITDAAGKFKVLAIDQIGSFQEAFKKTGKDATADDLRDGKLEMTRILGVEAGSVLLDVTFAARQAVTSGALPKGVGLVVRLEKGCKAGEYGYEEIGWNVGKIKRMGASAVKLLVYMDTSNKLYTDSQLDFVKRTCEQCAEHDILLMTEELSFPRGTETKDSPDYAKRKVENILKSTELLGPWTDILKLEFPGDENLDQLNTLAIRPWVLLSAGVDFDVFEKQVEAAMKKGASGIMAGRAIFKDWFKLGTPAERQNFLKTTGLERMRKLNGLVDKFATSWMNRCRLTAADLAAAVRYDWYSPVAAGAAPKAGVY
jgi:tagatose 1,6-diphosphate aldolase